MSPIIYESFSTIKLTIDSNILSESKRKDEFLEKIYEWCGYTKYELLYRGTRDGSKSSVFHKKCDDKGPTLCLYKNDKKDMLLFLGKRKVILNLPKIVLYSL